MTELSPDLAAAIDGVVLAIPQLEWVLGGDPPATIKEAITRYPVPSETSKILQVWMAWRAATRLRDVRDGNGLAEGATLEKQAGKRS